MNHHTSDPVCLLCEDKLLTAYPPLAQWYREKVKPAYPDSHVSWAFRDEADQEQAFLDKRSDKHWPNSPHNHMEKGVPCSLALDLFEINEDHVATWRPRFFREINDQNEIWNAPIMWGGLFKTLGDFDHFQWLQDID